jgi:negative regulator of sigma E activity
MTPRLFAILAFAVALSARAADTASGPEIAKALHAADSGNSYVRLKMETPKNGVLQIQIKSRRSAGSSELVYQVLWPKDRKGESVLLKKAGGSASGAVFIPPSTTRSLDAGQMSNPLFNSDLTYEDLLDDTFTWPQQAIVGTETVDRVPCQILESKPGKGDRTSYTSVRTWVDTRRMIPLKIEKYGASGKVIRRIETTKVANDDKGHPVPANLTVQGADGTTTQLDGSRIHHDLPFSDAEFTPEGIKQTAIPHGGASD